MEDESYARYAYRWMPLAWWARFVAPVANRIARVAGAGPVMVTRPFRGYPRLGTARRSIFSENWRCYKGHFWMALSRKAVDRVLTVLHERPEVERYYSTTLHPDESLVHTILLNDPELRALDEQVCFTIWRGGNSAHPNVIRLDDVDAVLASGAPFARKFDSGVDEAALDAVDAVVTAQR
jgi:hypothetical protein